MSAGQPTGRSGGDPPPSVPNDVTDAAGVLVIDLVRRGLAATRPDLVRLCGRGRSVVNDRVDRALASGTLEEFDAGQPTGGRGRLARGLRFVSGAGSLLVAVLGTAQVTVAVTDLSGAPIRARQDRIDVRAGAAVTLARICDLMDDVRADAGVTAPLWGIGLALPGAVDPVGGRPAGAPVMPGWEGFDVRAWFAERYEAPVWVDNDLNLLTLAQWQELDPARRRTDRDIVLVKVSYGIGAGILSDGRIHRGRNGSAGDIGHIPIVAAESVDCRCGRQGCLEAMAGGWALARDATVATREGRSAFLAERLAAAGGLTPQDVSDGVGYADAVCLDLIRRSATLLGETLSTLLSFYNPAVSYVGGIIPSSGDHFLAALRRAVYEHAPPLTTRDLRILPATVNQREALRGTAWLVLDQLFAPEQLALWVSRRSARSW